MKKEKNRVKGEVPLIQVTEIQLPLFQPAPEKAYNKKGGKKNE